VGRPQTGATAPTAPLPPGEEATRSLAGGDPLLGRYRLERRLGAGGFGIVWQAWDERLQREVAVKAVPRGDDGGRPEREARAAARLNHPGIVGLYELAADDHDVYLVSELVHGSTLAELSREGAVADRDVARIGAALCDALEHAHGRGVIHRDVKPQNVMVVAEPAAGAGFAKLTDFGVAHLVSGDPLTHTGDVVGTLAYMAPEQAEGSRATPASDVYSLALTLYEAWSGSNPVRARSPAATARRLGRALPSLSSRRRDLPTELCHWIDDALDPDPSVRPSPDELGTALREAEPELSDEGGLVEPRTLERFGLTAVRERGAGRLPRALARVGAGTGAGLLVIAALTQLGPEPPFSPYAAAGAAALLTAFLPRVGWALAALGTCAWLASPEAGREGTALVLAAALAPIPLLLPRAGPLWSLPALAPLLGTVALAPAFVGIASLAPGPWRRAGLAAAGLGWVAVAEVLTGDALLFGIPDGTLPRAEWQDSAGGAAADALYPLISSPALAPAVVWAAMAPLLPLVVRGRFLGLDLLAAAAWAAALVAAHVALGDLLASTTALDQARGAPAGALVGALVIVSAAAIAPREPLATGDPATVGRGIP
jgi:eukaryotic-like serine/threonine-protein kinase